tara:strand:- start:1806 stop:2453 length:648 start_codon:yes stop_codon:yes gene_type:complete
MILSRNKYLQGVQGMKKTISTIATALVLSLSIQGCTQKTESDDGAECSTAENDAMGDAQQSMDDAKHAASKAAVEAHNAARMSVTAAKLAVCSEAQKDKEAAAQMAITTEAAAKRAQARISVANSKLDLAVNENARKAEDLVKEAVAAASGAVIETNASLMAGLESDKVAAKKAAESAQKAVIKAAAATADASKAAQVAAKETWEKEMHDGGEDE